MDNALGVVPILVNVGAAIFPAVIAAVGSMIGILFRPRELLRFCAHRPGLAVGVLTVTGGVVAGIVLLAGWIPVAGPLARASLDEQIDWTEVAMRIIHRREIAARGAATTGPAMIETIGPFIYRGGPSRRGYDGGPVPGNLMPLWAYKQPDTMFLSSPAIVGRRVYGATYTLDPTGNYGSVFCLDARTGRQQWSVDCFKNPRTGAEEVFKAFFSSPAVTADGKYLVIGQGLHDDSNCSLLCLRASDGKLHWSIETPLHIEGSPAIFSDLVIAGAGAIEGPDQKPKGDPGFVLAVRISDGKELWRYPIRDPESSPVISADGVCYIGSGFGGNQLVALRTGTDEDLKIAGLERVIWRAETPHPATGAVTLCGDLVIIGCGNGNYVYANPEPAGAVIAFNRRTGKKAWEAVMPDAVLGAVAVGEGKAVCPVRNGEVVVLGLVDGQVIWRRRVNEKSPVLAAPAFAGRVVYAVSRDGTLAAMDALKGRTIEIHHLNDAAAPGNMGLSLSSPIVAGGWVFVGSETGGLRCFVGTGGER